MTLYINSQILLSSVDYTGFRVRIKQHQHQMRKVLNIFQRVFNLGSPRSQQPSHEPTIVTRKDHHLSRQNISQAALKVLYRLHKSGYCAYLVGGGVRDLLLGMIPKDFDVVTDAHPEEIQKLFSNSYIIGRRFRLVHVRFGNETIEVATFRSSEESKARITTKQGVLLRDNVYGTLEDDVWRRDFTINSLYYNIDDFSVVDFTGGIQDLESRYIRVIGNPDARYREDPARMLRAIRLAGKLNFEIDEKSAEPIKKNRELIRHIPPARLFDKMLKIFHSGKSFEIYQLLRSFDIIRILFPNVEEALIDPSFSTFVEKAFQNSDERVQEGKGINSAFLFAVLMWGPFNERKKTILESEHINEFQALFAAMSDVIAQQVKMIAIPRKLTTVVREIWSMQYHLEFARPKRVYRLLFHPRFRAAYDFLVLRGETEGSELQELGQWWTAFQEADDETRAILIKQRFEKQGSRRKKRRKRPA